MKAQKALCLMAFPRSAGNAFRLCVQLLIQLPEGLFQPQKSFLRVHYRRHSNDIFRRTHLHFQMIPLPQDVSQSLSA